jgi:hypothetical protein
MKRLRAIPLAAIVVVLVSLALSACGGGDTPPPTAPPSSPIVPVSTPAETPLQQPEISIAPLLTEEAMLLLLTEVDIQGIAAVSAERTALRERLTDSDGLPLRFRVDSSFDAGFQTADGSTFVFFQVTDYLSADFALEEFNRLALGMRTTTMPNPIGADSIVDEINNLGLGTVLLFVKGDRLVQMMTRIEDGQQNPLVDRKGLLDMARVVAGRL